LKNVLDVFYFVKYYHSYYLELILKVLNYNFIVTSELKCR